MPNHSAQFYMTGKGKAYLETILIGVVLVLVGVGFISEGPKHIPAFAAYAAGAVLILLTILLVIWLARHRRAAVSPVHSSRLRMKHRSRSRILSPANTRDCQGHRWRIKGQFVNLADSYWELTNLPI